MAAEDNAKGWMLHSHGQGRKFGPLTEDELRSYFRAGMVKSVDRLSAPGDAALLPAAEVAARLGESVPVGPPPPEPAAPPPPRPPVAPSALAGPAPRDPAAAPASGPSAEERAARAAAAMNIDLAALMSSNAPAKKRSAGWMVGALAVFLVAMLFVGLSTMRKLSAGAAQDPAQPPSALTDPGQSPGATSFAQPSQRARGPIVPTAGAPAEQAEPAADGHDDPLYEARFAQAEAMKNGKSWPELAAHATAWSQAQPDLDEPLQFLGMAQLMQRDFVDAEASFKKLLARKPDNAAVRAMLADTYLQEQKFPEALAIYKEMTAGTPDDSRLWNNFGAALNGAGQQAQAAAALENAVRLDPSFKQAWVNLGNVYQAMGEKSKADAAFARGR